MRTSRYARFAALGLALLALAWLLPYALNAERYRRVVQSRLEQALGRQVAFGDIEFRLIPRPGFSIHNVIVRERPPFGSEPFARVNEADCDLALGSLFRGRLGIGRLTLYGATITLARDGPGRWNVEPSTEAAGLALNPGDKVSNLTLEVDDARLNFKFGSETKPFAVTGVDGRVSVDRALGRVAFDLSGSPLRTDLALPSPGRVALAGFLSRVPGNAISVDARVTTRGALLYDWIPLLAGRNPQIYGLVDADVRLTGTVQRLDVSGQAHLTQLRRWEALPTAGSFPVSVALDGSFNRGTGAAVLDRLQVQFGQSRLSLAGTFAGIGTGPALNLTANVERSRWNDFLTLASRLAGHPRADQTGILAGSVDAAVRIAGPWSALQYSGSLSTRDGILVVRQVRAPLSNFEIVFDGRRIDLLPVTIAAQPHLQLVVEASFHLPDVTSAPLPRGVSPRRAAGSATSAPGYRVSIGCKSASAHEWVALARALGVAYSDKIDAHGDASASLVLAHAGWPPVWPTLSGQAEVRAARVLLPGLVQPIEILDTRLQLNDDVFSANPATVRLADTTFTGRLEHTGERSQPWTFAARSPNLNLADAATWIEALGRRPALPWFARIPGLSTMAERSMAGSDLFSALHAVGSFSTPALTYRRTTLRNVSAEIDISHRVIRVTSSRFRISSGRGHSTVRIDMRSRVPRLTADFALGGLHVENWSSHLSPQLAGVRGAAALEGQFAAEGRSQAQLSSSLEGRLRIHLANVALENFDPVRAAERAASWERPAPVRLPLMLRSTDLSLSVRNRTLELSPVRLKLGGAVFELAGNIGFDGNARLASTVNLPPVETGRPGGRDPVSKRVEQRFVLVGPLNDLRATAVNEPGAGTP